MSEDQYAICPFDKTHLILVLRMPAHILKCRKNYRGPPLDTCCYNATHLVPQGSMEDHLRSCKDGHTFNNPKYIKLADGSIASEQNNAISNSSSAANSINLL